jgi:hypothetical protein
MEEFLYVIAASPAGPCKIGHSANPMKRRRTLQTGNPQRLGLYHKEPVAANWGRSVEQSLHRDIHHLREHGEWFDTTVAEGILWAKYAVITYAP